MSETLKKIYEAENLLPFYFDKAVPIDLYRGQHSREAKNGTPIIYPNPGFTRANGTERLPDVRIVERDGQQFVLGCRIIQGDYRGISLFDRVIDMPGFKSYKLPAGAEIPPALAITQDENFSNRPNHYTIAPKDDMPLALFETWLNVLIRQLVPA